MARFIQNVLLTLIAVLLFAIVISRDTEAQSVGSGQYQIVSALDQVFRIDLQTGTVSRCYNECRTLEERAN